MRSGTGTTWTPGMADASPSDRPRRATLGVAGTVRRLNFEQRVAGVGALLLIVSTFGPFSFVEAAEILTGLAVLFLLRRRAEGREFHIPFGDGGVIAAAGAWAALLILARVGSRPLGQTLLAVVCAAVLLIAGAAERRKRPPDDLPGPHAEEHQRGPEAVEWEESPPWTPRTGDATQPLGEPRARVGGSDAPTEVGRRRRRSRGLGAAPKGGPPARRESQLELPTEPLADTPRDALPPPEFHLPREDDPPSPPPPPPPPANK